MRDQGLERSRWDGAARRWGVGAVIVLTALPGCVGPDGMPTFTSEESPPVGNLEVSTVTSGQNFDPDGYQVTLNELESQSIGINETILFRDIRAGQSQQARLIDIADNCAVNGANPQSVVVDENATSAIAFIVACS